MGTEEWSGEETVGVPQYDLKYDEEESDQEASNRSPRLNEETDEASAKEDVGPCTMLADQLYFSQAGVSEKFRNGQRILSVMKDLRDNRIEVESLPAIKVFPIDGRWFSADNRRLWCFKEAGLTQVPVQRISPSKQHTKKMSTENDGLCVIVRPSASSHINQKVK